MHLPSGNRAFWICLALLLLGCTAQIFAGYSQPWHAGHAWGIDDAYISYRYARNLDLGQGLVFNPGERVEGYSNLLYVLIIALGMPVVGVQHVYVLSACLNLVFVALALRLFHRHLFERLGAASAGTGALLFALYPPVWAWVASGL